MMNNGPIPISVQLVNRPARMLILKRGKLAVHYFAYCEEVGCEVWNTLCRIKGALYEPVGMWMPECLRPEGTSVYVQGVEVPLDYAGPIPDGFATLSLPPCKMLIFQGPPYAETNMEEAIRAVQNHMATYHPEELGYAWDNAIAPRIQLEPKSKRGYIEGRPVRALHE